MTFDEFEEELCNVLHGMEVTTDNDGQIIVYTGMCIGKKGQLVEFEPKEEKED